MFVVSFALNGLDGAHQSTDLPNEVWKCMHFSRVCVLFTIYGMGLGFLFHMLAAVIEGTPLYLDRFSLFTVLFFLAQAGKETRQHSWRWSAGYYTDVFQ